MFKITRLDKLLKQAFNWLRPSKKDALEELPKIHTRNIEELKKSTSKIMDKSGREKWEKGGAFRKSTGPSEKRKRVGRPANRPSRRSAVSPSRKRRSASRPRGYKLTKLAKDTAQRYEDLMDRIVAQPLKDLAYRIIDIAERSRSPRRGYTTRSNSILNSHYRSAQKRRDQRIKAVSSAREISRSTAA